MPHAEAADQVLNDIRRAAFELRQQDPAEAVRRLRKLLKSAGPAEPLVHGALAEILLDDFDDLDGAEHHFRQLAEKAPDLPAAQMGLGRTLARQGHRKAAAEALAKASEGLLKLIAGARAAPEEERAGVEEAVLTLLELADERAELAEDGTSVEPPDELLAWVESERLFDGDESEASLDDWERYAAHRALITLRRSGGVAALDEVARIAMLVPLTGAPVARLRSFVHERAGEPKLAAGESLVAMGSLDGDFDADEALRAGQLLADAGEKEAAKQHLERLIARMTRELSRAPAEARPLIETVRDAATEQLKSLGPKLVGLGSKKR